MKFNYKNINYDVIDIQQLKRNVPLYRQNAMTFYHLIKPNILGMKELKEDGKLNEQYIGYLILCKINNFMEWIEVDKTKGEEIINNKRSLSK